MAVLSAADRLEAAREFMERWSSDRSPIPVTKAELLAAINATDDWTEANQVSFNQALPQPARGALSSRDKAAILMYVVAKRFGVL
jgi:hypothetical protein